MNTLFGASTLVAKISMATFMRACTSQNGMLITVAIGIITVSLSSAVFYKYFLDATGGVRAFLAAKGGTVFCTVRTYLFNSVDVTLLP